MKTLTDYLEELDAKDGEDLTAFDMCCTLAGSTLCIAALFAFIHLVDMLAP